MLELCMCAQRLALGMHAGFQLEALTVEVISGFVFFVSIFLESGVLVKQPPGGHCQHRGPSWEAFSRVPGHGWSVGHS